MMMKSHIAYIMGLPLATSVYPAPVRTKGPSVWPKNKATLKRRAKNQAARKARKKNRRK